jgi:radical SAM superfamily enzyme YgiQ (UPF0313 family)
MQQFDVNVLIFTDCSGTIFSRAAGAYRIATELRNNGYTVQVVDHFLLAGLQTTLDLVDKFVGPSTLFVGFSTTFMNPGEMHLKEAVKDTSTVFKVNGVKTNQITAPAMISVNLPLTRSDLQVIRDRILSKSPNAKLVMGGAKTEYRAKDQVQIDTYLSGYADTSVVEYVKYLDGKNPFFQFKTTPDGRMLIDHDVMAANFDFKHSTIEYQESDFISPGEVLPIEISRGCIFKCKFCAFVLTGKKRTDHLKDREVLYSELMRNYEKFGTTKYLFSDDTYNDSVAKLEYFAETFRKLPFKIEYAAYLRHDLIATFPEMADLLMESGIKSAIFGLETLNHTAGKIVGKGMDPKKIKEMLLWLRNEKGWAKNILMTSGFMVGLPTESQETVMSWAEELWDPTYPLDSFIFSPLTIYPDTNRIGKSEFEKEYEKYGYWFDLAVSSGWINEHWDYDKAKVFANWLTTETNRKGRSRMLGFPAMMAHNYGATWEQIHTMRARKFLPNIFARTQVMANNYHSKLLAL